MRTPAIRGLYAVTDTALLQGRLLPAVTAAVAGGAGIVQYRDKSSEHARRLQEACALRRLCHDHGALLLINDDVELALQSSADGVHLGQSDTALALARQQLGAGAVIGITCHDRSDLAMAAIAGGADYLAFGAMFASATKPQARVCPLGMLSTPLPASLPRVAIGGITPDNVRSIIDAGAHAVAVVASLWNAPDIRARARQFSQEFDPQ